MCREWIQIHSNCSYFKESVGLGARFLYIIPKCIAFTRNHYHWIFCFTFYKIQPNSTPQVLANYKRKAYFDVERYFMIQRKFSLIKDLGNDKSIFLVFLALLVTQRLRHRLIKWNSIMEDNKLNLESQLVQESQQSCDIDLMSSFFCSLQQQAFKREDKQRISTSVQNTMIIRSCLVERKESE